jgi:hypothetical protein
MAADPAAALSRALGRLDIELPVHDAPPEHLATSCGHAIGGNDRVRFGGEDTPVTVDEAWRRELRGPRLRFWSLLAAPGLLRFGYPVWRTRPDETGRD